MDFHATCGDVIGPELVRTDGGDIMRFWGNVGNVWSRDVIEFWGNGGDLGGVAEGLKLSCPEECMLFGKS
jgi:hypothetical protein